MSVNVLYVGIWVVPRSFVPCVDEGFFIFFERSTKMAELTMGKTYDPKSFEDKNLQAVGRFKGF